MNYLFSFFKESKKISFEDMQYAQKSELLIISTLPNDEQHILIHGTVSSIQEIASVERALKLKNPIIIYGKNGNDETVHKKYEQITKLGGIAHIYVGGLFEWLLLQDIYGIDEFSTSNKTLEILKYKPINILNTKYLTY